MGSAGLFAYLRSEQRFRLSEAHSNQSNGGGGGGDDDSMTPDHRTSPLSESLSPVISTSLFPGLPSQLVDFFPFSTREFATKYFGILQPRKRWGATERWTVDGGRWRTVDDDDDDDSSLHSTIV